MLDLAPSVTSGHRTSQSEPLLSSVQIRTRSHAMNWKANVDEDTGFLIQHLVGYLLLTQSCRSRQGLDSLPVWIPKAVTF